MVIELKVAPLSGRQELILDKSGILKCFIKSPPEDGKANKELIDFLSSKLNISKKNIEIVHGLTCRKKRIVIQTLNSYEQFLMRVGLVQQNTLFKL